MKAISLPLTDDRLGMHLVRAGAAERRPVDAGAYGGGGRRRPARATHKPLGQRLVERGFISEAVVRQAMCRLTMTRMFELAHWRTGMFTLR